LSNITVSVTSSGEGGPGLKVYVLTGVKASSFIGSTGSGDATANNATPTGYNATAASSFGIAMAVDLNNLAPPSSTDVETLIVNGDLGLSAMSIVKAAPASAVGVPVTFNMDAAGTAAADWHWVAVEFLVAAVDASVTPATIAVPAAMPAPAKAVSASRTPATIAVPAAMPVAGVSAGAGKTPATITASVAMPTPVVTTEDVQIVTPATIEATVAMPVPAAQGSASAAPATIAASVAMPAPAVRADAEVTFSTIAVGTAMPRPIASVPPLPGDRITRWGQIEWNGFLLGEGTPYSWQGLQGWRDLPPIISGNVDQPDANGSYPGQPYAGERIINWGTLLQARPDQVAQLLRDLQMGTGRSQTEDEGTLVIWDFADAEPYLVYGHLTKRDPGEINQQAAQIGLMRGALQWTCSDPAIYSLLRQSVPIPIGVELDVLNDGNEASTRVIYRIPGPCTVPQVENLSLDRVFGFDVEIADGEVLEIDVKEGNVTIGGVDHLNTLIEGSTSVKDMVFGPGPNKLLWSAESGGSLMNVLWRHASA
jgi:hypothetical protein